MRRRGRGRDRVKEEGARTRKRSTAAPPTAPRSDEKGQTAHGPHTTAALAAARDFYGTTQPPGGWERYERELDAAITIAGDRLSTQALAEAFDITSPRRPLPGEWPDKFIGRICGDCEMDESELGRKAALLAQQQKRAFEAGDHDLVDSLQREIDAL